MLFLSFEDSAYIGRTIRFQSGRQNLIKIEQATAVKIVRALTFQSWAGAVRKNALTSRGDRILYLSIFLAIEICIFFLRTCA